MNSSSELGFAGIWLKSLRKKLVSLMSLSFGLASLGVQQPALWKAWQAAFLSVDETFRRWSFDFWPARAFWMAGRIFAVFSCLKAFWPQR